MHPIGRLVEHLDIENERHHQVADDHDHQIGREVVRAVMVQLLAAHVATIRYLQEGPEHVALAAIRAAPAEAIPEVGSEGVVAHGREIGPNWRAINARGAACSHFSLSKTPKPELA